MSWSLLAFIVGAVTLVVAAVALLLAERRMTYSSGRNAGRLEAKVDTVLDGRYSELEARISTLEANQKVYEQRLSKLECDRSVL